MNQFLCMRKDGESRLHVIQGVQAFDNVALLEISTIYFCFMYHKIKKRFSRFSSKDVFLALGQLSCLFTKWSLIPIPVTNSLDHVHTHL